MKNILSLVLVLFLSTVSYSQIGVQLQYQKYNDTSYTFTGSGTKEAILSDQIGYGIDYAFKLKDYRIEFFPTLLYFTKKIEKASIDGTVFQNNISTVGFQFNTHFYFLDIEGDCNCPTWNKDGSFMKKGLFAWVSLNAYHNHILQNKTTEKNFLSYGAGAGLGLDIGLSKHFTLTPLAGLEFEHRPLVNLADIQADAENKFMSKFNGALRFAYHWGK